MLVIARAPGGTGLASCPCIPRASSMARPPFLCPRASAAAAAVAAALAVGCDPGLETKSRGAAIAGGEESSGDPAVVLIHSGP